MLDNPVFNNFSSKTYDIILVICIAIMYIAVCIEMDIYVSTFPQMVIFFDIPENKIQLILSVSLFGSTVSSLIVGPLSDIFGRRKVLIYSLFFLVISGIGCIITINFIPMLIWRLVQGISSAAPIVIGAAIVFDRYPPKKSSQIIGIMNSIIAALMVAAPVIGAFISTMFSWKANFIIIMFISAVAFIVAVCFIKETIPCSHRTYFKIDQIIFNYIKILKSPYFIGYTIIVNFAVTSITVYVSNLSIIYVNHNNLSVSESSYYQASTMLSFIIFSILSIKTISKKGIDYTKNLGGSFALVGAIFLLVVGLVNYKSINLICLSMALIAGGGAMMASTFGLKIISIFPNIKGTSLAVMTTIRYALATGLVSLSEIYFDGTIFPVSIIIFIYALICLVIFILLFFLKESCKN